MVSKSNTGYTSSGADGKGASRECTALDVASRSATRAELWPTVTRRPWERVVMEDRRTCRVVDEKGLNAQADELIEELRVLARPRLIVISGPSGVGKDTVIEHLRLVHPEFFFAVTATTRSRRPGEIDGVHYIFLTREIFLDTMGRGEFLESAEVYGHLYGVPKDRVRRALQSGKTVVVKVDVQGAGSIRKIIPDAVFIFLVPPSMAELTRRLRGRKTDDPAVLMARIATASQELRSVGNFDYVVFNESDKLDETLNTIDAIIKAEGCRVRQRVLDL
jgi:guanylate kinase